MDMDTAMKPKPSFKLTEIGWIPEDWEVVCFKDVIEIDPEQLKNNTDPNFSFNYIALENVEQGRLINYSEEVFSRAPSRARRILRDNDVIMSTVRPNLKSHFFYKSQIKNAICSTGFAVLRAKINILESKYLYYHLFGNVINNQIDKIIAGSNYPAISSYDVKNLKIPLPPLPEQHAIATVLSDVDKLIESLDELINKKQAMKKATMHLLLTGKKRLPGFTDEWLKRKLGDVAELKNGYGFKSNDYIENGQYIIITIQNVQDGFLDISKYNSINQLPINIQEHHILKLNDILISMTGNVGRVCKVTIEKSLLNQRVGKIIPIDVDREFLFYVLLSDNFKNKMINSAEGGAQGNISKSDIENYIVNIPSDKSEQQAIAQVLSDMDSEIDALQAKRDKLKQLKQGMMQVLLTGKIRLVETSKEAEV